MATILVRGRKKSQQTDEDDPRCHRLGSVTSSSEGGGERMSLQGQTGERTADSLSSNGENQAVNSQPGDDRPSLELQSKRDRLWIFLDDPSVSRGVSFRRPLISWFRSPHVHLAFIPHPTCMYLHCRWASHCPSVC